MAAGTAASAAFANSLLVRVIGRLSCAPFVVR
jgi:hypothetical protein